MRLILEAGADWRYKNLPTNNKVAVIILNKYSDISFHNIILMECRTPNKQL
jgi:hypothetical protein